VLVRALRSVGADVDWYLPSRIDDGYGLALSTVEKLAARGTKLLITVDCAVTAVEEVAAARAPGLTCWSPTITRHGPTACCRSADRASGAGRLSVPGAVRRRRRVQARPGAAGGRGPGSGAGDEDLDLVALATVADVVPLRGENRRLVRAGCGPWEHAQAWACGR
jgi:single-stranded-DNA-specific exonuclease